MNQAYPYQLICFELNEAYRGSAYDVSYRKYGDCMLKFFQHDLVHSVRKHQCHTFDGVEGATQHELNGLDYGTAHLFDSFVRRQSINEGRTSIVIIPN